MQEARVPATVGGGVDLHLHSTCSDGLLAPEEVVRLAAAAGLSTISLTDHDTLDGVPAATEEGRSRGIEVVPGVEVSCSLPEGSERHVLGYGVDLGETRLQAVLERNRQARRDRLQGMVDALASVGVRLSVEDILAQVPGPSVGRPHVAAALVGLGLVASRQEAFDRWLGDGKIACVRKQNVGCEEAIRALHEAGGVAVLAHPGRRRDHELVARMASWGLDGVEVTHPMNQPDDVRALTGLVAERGMLATGGSDCHGDPEGLANMRARRVPTSVADALRERLAARATRRTSR
jgi:hypothetical protein